MATRIVQTILRNPQSDGVPLCGWKTSVRLVVPSFDENHYEVIRTSTVTSALAAADEPGLLSIELEVNADITKPTGTYYTWNVASGVTWYFIVPTGDAETPVWLEDCLTADPTQPIPAGAASQAELDAFETFVSGTYVSGLEAQSFDDSGAQARSNIGAASTVALSNETTRAEAAEAAAVGAAAGLAIVFGA